LPIFSATVIQMGSFTERAESRECFRGILPSSFSDTTLIGDSTHFPVNSKKGDVYQGHDSIYGVTNYTNQVNLF
jgi:hypothetical protein